MYAHDFQCKHLHNYNDVLFHIFADRMMPAPGGAKPEHIMCQALILFMKENIDKVEQIAQPFLSKKKLTLDAYIAFMEQPGHWGDELALHLLAVMNQIHYCVIMKTQVFYSHPTFSSPGDIHIKLVYLGNSIFRDTTTLTKKCPSPPHIDFNQPLPQDTTPREAHHKNWEQKRQQQESQSESEYAQESQESDSESEKEKEDTSPPHPKKGKRKLRVVKSKEYKIWRPKKRHVLRKYSLCSESFTSQKELNDHVVAVHNYKFLCSDRECGKAFGS